MLRGSDYKNARIEGKGRLLNSRGSMIIVRNEGKVN